jgi:hypothetical protein
MVPEISVVASYARQATIWRRLSRVTFEYPGGAIVRCTGLEKDDLNAIAAACAAAGLKLAGVVGCVERWYRC